jgi:hypothetical protein
MSAEKCGHWPAAYLDDRRHLVLADSFRCGPTSRVRLITRTIVGEIAVVKETRTTLVVRIALGIALAIISGEVIEYFKSQVTQYAQAGEIATAVALATVLYLGVFKPLLIYADAQRKTRQERLRKMD